MAVYKYVSDKLIRYLNEMYGITNIDKVPAKIVTKEFECNGFTQDGEEVDGTVKIPKDLIVFTSANGTSISKNAKKKSQTDNNYKYLGFITLNETINAPASGSKGSVIKESDIISKGNICDVVNDKNSNVISFNLFKKAENGFITKSQSESLRFEDLSSLSNSDYEVYGKYTIQNLKAANSLEGTEFYIIYPYETNHNFMSDNHRRYYIVVKNSSQADEMEKFGTIFIHSVNGIRTAVKEITGHSLVITEINELKKLATNFAAGTNEYLFMGASESIKDLANDLKNIAGCSSDETGIPINVGSNMKNIFACKIGAMFNGWFNKKEMSVSGNANDFQYNFNNENRTIDLNSFNKLIEDSVDENIETMSDDDFAKENNNIAKKFGVEAYSPIKKESIGIKRNLYKLIKEDGSIETAEGEMGEDDFSDIDIEKYNQYLKSTLPNKNQKNNNQSEKEKRNSSIFISRVDMIKYYEEQVRQKIENGIKSLNSLFTQFDEGLDKNNEMYKDDLDIIDKDIKKVYDTIKGLFYYDSKKQADLKSKATLQEIYKILLKTFQGDEYKTIIVETIYNEFSNSFYENFSNNLENISIGKTFPSDNNAVEVTKDAMEAEKQLKNENPTNEHKIFDGDHTLKLFEIKSNLYSILSNKLIVEKMGNEEGQLNQVELAKQNSSNWMFINDVSIKNNVESNLFGRMNSDKVNVFDDCYLTTSKVRSIEGNAEKWANSLSSTMDSVIKFGEVLSGFESNGLIKTDTSLSLIGKGISGVAKGVKKVSDTASSISSGLGKAKDDMRA